MHPKARKIPSEGRDRSHVAAAAGARSATKPFEQLVAEARSKLDQLDNSAAAVLFENALEQRPDDVDTLDALGDLYFSVGDGDRARELLLKAVKLRPAEATPAGAARWLYLGELDEGLGAAEKLLRGTSLLRQFLGEAPLAEDSPERRASARDLSGAFCSLAELFMTDLCDEDGAAARCDEFAAAAVAADEENAEAHRVLADLRMCQERPGEALAPVLRAIELLHACYPPDEDDEEEEDAAVAAGAGGRVTAGHSRRGSSGPSVTMAAAAAAAAASSGDAAATASALAALEFASQAKLAQLPPWESRLRMAQIAMELEAYAPAADVLVRLLEEDDTAMEVWFLLAEAHFLQGEPEEAQEYLEEAMAMVSAALEAVAGKAGRRGGAGARKQRGGGGGLGAVALRKEGVSSAAPPELVALGRAELEAQLAKFGELAEKVAAARAGPVAAASVDDDMAGEPAAR